jgi:small-conductance mechanosensitive channel
METLTQLWQDVQSFFASYRLAVILRTLIVIVVGVALSRLISAGIHKVLTRKGMPHRALVYRQLSFYVALAVVVFLVLRSLGVKPAVLLGAAGVLTVALGFASQTSASNIISGLFLLGEKPFEVGDFIKVGETVGQVLAIDMLSAKLRTYDNLFVRVPNETLLKSEITNYTRHPLRRLDIKFGVAYKEDTEKVREVLMKVADQNPLVLDEPKPFFLFLGFGTSSLELQFSVWLTRETYWTVMAPFKRAVRKALADAGIEIPFPHRSLYAGSVTEPFPIQIVASPPFEGLPKGADVTGERPLGGDGDRDRFPDHPEPDKRPLVE